ncbi:MAG: IS21 family transposase [Candidatus Thiodiazotropha sp.]|nr:IS21 family transposase [Candidatus Thiodiazotropha sp.]MCM8885679.1 IS21 family transposase [Candidatus Thiodiazotropha sp.]MCM8922331.1 IS21 family transposase [Candidatus Thiodiazotropha sp.]
MALLSVIRRWHFREGIPIREITRRTGLSRNTVRKYLASGVVEPRYPHRKTPSKLDDYEHTLTSWLFRESRRHRKQRRSVKQLHSDLVQLGYTGSYDRVAAFARHWRQAQQEAKRTASKHTFIPLTFAPGEAFQFDWSEDYAVINGVNTKLQVAHFKLSHSRAFFLQAYLLQTHEMLFDAHYYAFQAFGGVPERGIYDNMKTAVDKVGRGKQRIVNKRFLAMASHYLFEAEFCNPAAGWEKGQVEKGVRDARHRLWHGAPAFKSLSALNHWLNKRCSELWQELPHPEDKRRTLHAYWQAEQEHLMAVPAAFDGFVEFNKRVSSTCLITFDNNRYSVPASFANHPVSLRVYADRLVVVAEANVIAVHERVFTRDHNVSGKTVYDWRHYLSVVQRKPGALRNGAPFHQLPESFRQLQAKLLRRAGGDREMVEVLALVLLHDEHMVEQAVSEALRVEQPSKQHVLNCLSRLCDAPKPKPSLPPPTLKLVIEPVADTDRYDRLRRRQS